MREFGIGSDPEIFLVNSDGKLISSIGLVGGSKTNPRQTTNGSVQEDNVLLEFNSLPSFTAKEFVKNHVNIMKDVSDIVAPLGLQVSIQATGVFSEDQLQDDKAKVAGCEPDFDAWTKTINNPPNLSESGLRSGAGHLHISCPDVESSYKKRMDIVKALDLTCGVPSVLMDMDTTRRSLYGKAGCHRPKLTSKNDGYDGVEYRTMSNFWLKSEELIQWAFEAAEMGIVQYDELAYQFKKDPTIGARIRYTINNGDTKEARLLCDEFNLLVVGQ